MCAAKIESLSENSKGVKRKCIVKRKRETKSRVKCENETASKYSTFVRNRVLKTQSVELWKAILKELSVQSQPRPLGPRKTLMPRRGIASATKAPAGGSNQSEREPGSHKTTNLSIVAIPLRRQPGSQLLSSRDGFTAFHSIHRVDQRSEVLMRRQTSFTILILLLTFLLLENFQRGHTLIRG